MLELRLRSLGSDINWKFKQTIPNNGSKNLIEVVFWLQLYRKYTGRTSNTVTNVKDRSHEDCAQELTKYHN